MVDVMGNINYDNDFEKIFVNALETIEMETDRITSGNLSHHIASIKHICRSVLTLYHDFKDIEEEGKMKTAE